MNNIISYEDFLLESKVDDLAGIVIIVNNTIVLNNSLPIAPVVKPIVAIIKENSLV